MKLDKNGPLTLTFQLTECIRERITKDYHPGDLLPTEKEMVEEYDVSVITVRNALETLVNEGLIYRQRGKGTFVSEPKISSESSKLTSATELFRQAGRVSNVEVLDFSVETAGLYHAKMLGCHEMDPVYKLVRLRTLDGEPYSHETNYLPVSIFKNLDFFYKNGSLYECMEKNYGVIPSKSEEIYKAILLESPIAKLLHRNRGDAALSLTGKVFDNNGRIISMEESVYRADRFELKVIASANGAESKRIIGEKEL